MRNWMLAGGVAVALVVTGALFVARPERAMALGGEGLEIIGTGKINHYHGSFALGAKTFVNKVAAADVVRCITGDEPSCSGQIEANAGGKAYLFFDSATSWRAGTDPTGADSTPLTGFIGGRGEFTFTGYHELSDTRLIVSGKAKFKKGTSEIQALKGKFTAISEATEHVGFGGFRSVGKVFFQPSKR